MARSMSRITIVSTLLLMAVPAVAQTGEDGVVDVDGVPIRYHLVGEGPPVVLIHGWASDFEHSWRMVAPELAGEFTVVGMDMRGHGQSGKPESPAAYGLEYADDVIALLDHLGFERAHLGGYSLGGGVALNVATRYPDRISSLILVGAGLYSRDDLEGAGRAFAQVLDGASSVGSAFVPDIFNPGPELREEFIAQMNQNDPATLATTVLNAYELAVPEEAAVAVDAPVVGVFGERDGNLPSARRLAESHGNMEIVVVPDVGHLDIIRTPDLAGSMLDFLRSTPPPAASAGEERQ